ncbi:acyltransferase [Hymenobacter sp. UV11]|uniref:acyltransferase n=1 Tax=Hymenobacter sp. UV11 TaxID=1849735 RepID=UPI00106214D0|nr:acyltransferase [Hymenobacter sp. UV11]TFZ63329.1 acyltransferase [Hymenobacter sp. UV11]
MFLKIIVSLLPWPLRRKALEKLFGYEIHPTASIGLAWIFPNKLIMKAHARIDHFTVAIHLDSIRMERESFIGRSNWITGFPTNSSSPHFKHQTGRQASLVLYESSSVTKNHHFDCTNTIEIGRFATIAGYQSQFLTHSIDIFENRQDSAPILIGAYAFVGTNSVILGGAHLPTYCVLGAKSLLNKSYVEEWTLYGGVPAKELRKLPKSAKYFTRTEGFVF